MCMILCVKKVAVIRQKTLHPVKWTRAELKTMNQHCYANQESDKLARYKEIWDVQI